MREDLLWLTMVEEMRTDGYMAGWEVRLFCGGRSHFVSEREAAPLGETGENGQERVVLWSAFKGRGQLLLGFVRKDRRVRKGKAFAGG